MVEKQQKVQYKTRVLQDGSGVLERKLPGGEWEDLARVGSESAAKALIRKFKKKDREEKKP